MSITLNQILIFLLISFLIFGDTKKVKKKLKHLFKSSRKKET